MTPTPVIKQFKFIYLFMVAGHPAHSAASLRVERFAMWTHVIGQWWMSGFSTHSLPQIATSCYTKHEHEKIIMCLQT